MKNETLVRTLVLAALLGLTSAYLTWADRAEAAPLRQNFSEFPMQVGAWSGRPATEFSSEVLATLALDDHLNRFYASSRGQLAHVYVGYYASQRQGASIHSPLNCLPGAGWLPVSNSRMNVNVSASPEAGASQTIAVNRYVIQKGLDKQLVLYWYQSHGRVVASEYWSKAYLVLDSIRIHRSDAALVRVIAPIREGGSASEAASEAAAIDLVQSMFPYLGRFMPS
jgi:EpsI family protein